MTLEDFFQRLSFGELSNLSIGSDGAGTIAPDQQGRVISYTNAALRELYARFSHKRDYVKILLSEGRTRYQLVPANTVSENQVPDPYILDSVEEPFTGDLIRIIEIWCEDDPSTTEVDEEARLHVDDAANRISVRTLSYNTLYVPKPVEGAVLTIEYDAQPERLDPAGALSQSFDLSPALENALELRVAARVYSAMNGEVHLAKAQGLLGQFERECALIENKDLLRQTETANHASYKQRGWV